MLRNTLFIVSAIVLSGLFFLSTPSSTIAAEDSTKNSLVIAPAYQTIDIKKGESVTSQMTLTNNSQKTMTFNLFTLNFAQNDKGLIEFLNKDNTTYSYALASFINLQQDSITVEAHSKETVEFTINDRQDLSPGGHYAAIVAQADTQSQIKGATQFTPALASLLLLRKIGGEIFNLSLKDVSWPHNMLHFTYPSTISLVFQNEGNIHVIPRGRIDVYDMFGRNIYKGVLNTASQYVFPSSRRTISIPLKKISFTLPFSVDHIVIKGNDSLNKVSFAYRNTYIHADPLALLLFVVIIILLIIIIKKKIRKT